MVGTQANSPSSEGSPAAMTASRDVYAPAAEDAAPIDDGVKRAIFNDDDASEAENAAVSATVGPYVNSNPGVQVFNNAAASESEDEEEADQTMADVSGQPALLPPSAPAEPANTRQPEAGESPVAAMDVQVPVGIGEGADEGQSESEEESEAEEDSGCVGAGQVDAGQMLAGATVPEEVSASAAAYESEALVAAEPSQVVPSPRPDVCVSLPAEATSGEWLVQGEVCSLQMAGSELQLPKAIYDRLYTYQRQGVAWMWNLFQLGFGGILADEMGLGKTVQVASFIASLMLTGNASRILVVCPVTLVEQWRRELGNWAADAALPVHIFHGDMPSRRKALRGLLTRGGVLLTTYDLVRTCCVHLGRTGSTSTATLLPKKRKKAQRGCRDDDSLSEEEPLPQAGPEGQPVSRPWDVVIVDEGHQIKNPSCENGRALRKMESRSRFLLTGTPLHNKLSDLWALMDFSQPGLLGNHATFERNFSEQIARGSRRNAKRFDVELKDNLARELKRLTAPHFLRRMKSDVGMASGDATVSGMGAQPTELPPKTDIVLWLNLTQAQRELYELMLNSDLVKRATGSSKCGMEALRAINLLKKLSNHPLLCLPPDEFNDWRSAVAPPGGAVQAVAPAAVPHPEAQPEASQDQGDESQQAAECQQVLPRLRALLPGSAQTAALLSCKLRVLGVLLPQLQKRGHRCIIFSHSTKMLDLIQMTVLRVLGLKFLRIDGTIKREDRDVKISKFQQPDSRYFCICMSSQVGGVGLTITGADRVILCDPAWNPAMDAQAIDRVHRIGQDRDVVVYRLVCAGAIEDKMFRLQVFKRGLEKTIFEAEQQVRFFTQKELKQLFESPSEATSTQTLMAQQIDKDALEHEGLLSVVAGDVGGTDDPDALPFWQSTDVMGFSDCTRLLAFVEQSQEADGNTAGRAKELAEKLCGEEYVADQVLSQKLKREPCIRDRENVSPQENLPSQEEFASPMPIQNE